MKDLSDGAQESAPAGQTPVRLVTIHGTGAGDTTATGDRWWQLESGFVGELCQRLDLDPARVTLEPFQWKEGPNSEDERRQAGTRLLDRLRDYEAAGVEYYLVGHSHGGSVIHHALLQAVRAGIALDGLKQWCTVGTPFMDYRAKKGLFRRLNVMGLTVYASGISAFLIAGSHWASTRVLGWENEIETFLDHFSWALAIYGTLCILALFLMERRRKSWFSHVQKQQVEERFGARWLGLWHLEDEAISALYNIRTVSGSIVPTSFLQPIIALAQLLLVLGFGLVVGVNTLDGGFMLEDIAVWLVVTEDKISPDDEDIIFLIMLVTLVLAAFLLAVWVVTWVLKKLMLGLGIPMAAMLNRVIWGSIRQRTWGDDMQQEGVWGAAAHPPSFERSFDPLPDIVAGPLREHSDGHAISTLNKVRLILGMAGDEPGAADIRSELAESLKWKELIHTSYFDVPEFVDLLAIGMHRAGLGELRDGFAGDAAMQARMRGWLEGGTVASATKPAA